MSQSNNDISPGKVQSVEEMEDERYSLVGWQATLSRYIAYLMTIFHLYTAYFGIFTAFRQRAAHILFALFLVFFLYRGRDNDENRTYWYDWVLIALAIFSYGYIVYYANPLSSRHHLVTPLSDIQMAAGIIGILLLVEAARRVMGKAFMIILSVFIIYALFGQHLPGLLSHRGFDLMWAIDHVFFTWEGVFGIPAAVSSTYVFMFICFANFLKYTGAGDFFINLAISAMGKYRGGPAKISIFASGIMGTVSGSATANVVATGSVTIPLMKRVGYKPHFAGAVESVSSTGGMIMPPVMGAAAFIMAEYTGIPYVTIIGAAAIPAVLYFLALGFQVHFEAVRTGLQGMDPGEIPNFIKTLLGGIHYFIPIIVIFYVLLTGYSPLYAALFALIAVLIVSSFKKESRITRTRFLNALEYSAKGAIVVAIACAGAGIIVGVVSLTGIGIRFSSLIVQLSGGFLPLALVFTMVAAIILGMGLPPSAAYIIQASLLTPALVNMGVPLIAAHLFCFYYANLSLITPPVAIAAFAAASLAGAEPFKTGYTAVKLGIAAYIVPFMFVYGPALVLQGTPWEISIAVITAIIGVYSLAVASIGHYRLKTTHLERVLFALGALTLIYPNIIFDLFGFVLVAAGIILNTQRSKKIQVQHVTSS